jgi:hypothetical protein
VRTVSKSGLPRVNQLDVGLMNERGGIQASIRSLATEAAASQLAEPIVDQGHKTVQRLGVAIAPLLEQTRDVGGSGFDRGLQGRGKLDATVDGLINIASYSAATNPYRVITHRCIPNRKSS